MEVIERIKPTTKEEKMRVLQELREDIGEESFRICVAKVYTKDIIELMYWRGKKISRMDLYDRVNLTLVGYGCEPLSYGWFRDWL
jgi:hypothetical protein